MDYQTKQSLIDGIVKDIASIYSNDQSTSQDIYQAIAANVFMVTVKLDGIDLRGLVDQSRKLPFDVKLDVDPGYKNYLRLMGQSERYPDLHLYLDAFDRWYRYLMVQSFGRKFYRWIDHQPLAYAFIDHDDSRVKEGGETIISKYEFEKLGRHHVHAILALRPGIGQQCVRPLRQMRIGFDEHLKEFGNVHINPFDPDHGLRKLVAYCSKGARAVDDGDAWGDLYQVFPPTRADRGSLKPKSAIGTNSAVMSVNGSR